MTAGQLRDQFPALMELGNAKVPNEVASYAIGKAIRKATPEFKDIETHRLALCQTHAKKDDAGVPVLYTNPDGKEAFVFEDLGAFQTALDALFAESVTLTGVRAVTIAELKGTEVAPHIFAMLDTFVTE